MLVGEAYLHSSYEKRCVDLIGAAFVAATLGVPTLFGAVAIRMIEHQSMIFRNKRIGQDWLHFNMLKLTTMQNDAHIYEQQWQQDNTDPRITKVGRVLRCLNLNEVPQVENIRKGDMHFIGARAVNEHVLDRLQEADGALFDDWKAQYGLFKPGLFGKGQLLERKFIRLGDLKESSRQRMLGDLSYWESDASVITDLRITAEIPRELILQLVGKFQQQ